MKKRTKIILWVIGIIAIIILPDANMYYQRFKLKGENLPEAYKNYAELDSLKDDTYEVVKIDGGYHQPVIQLNDSTIMINTGYSDQNNDGSRTEKYIWYKINLKGQLADSLRYIYNDQKQNHTYITYNDYVVDAKNNTYNTWIKNNDATNKPIANLNTDKVFSSAEAEKLITTHEYVHTETIFGDNDQTESKEKIIIFKDGIFNYFYAKKDFHESAPDRRDHREVEYDPSAYEVDGGTSLIKRKYVKKDEWVGHTFWDSRTFSYGSGNGSGRIGWWGTSYFDLQMPEKVIHFTQPVEIEYPDEGVRDRFSYHIFQPKNGAYLLLNDIGNTRYYLIRLKRL